MLAVSPAVWAVGPFLTRAALAWPPVDTSPCPGNTHMAL